MVRDERKKQTTKEMEKVCLVGGGKTNRTAQHHRLVVTSMKCESRTCASHVTLPEELDLWLRVFGRH